jgi:hypothetical protein
MTVFTKLEKQIGKVELWPSYILLHLFVDLPDHVTMRKVAAFFFGNGVEKSCAASCYAACNTFGMSHEIIDTIYDWYYRWENCTHGEHLASYFNMRTRHLTWINGKELDQHEEVHPKSYVPDIEIECLATIDADKFTELKCGVRKARGDVYSDGECVVQFGDESQERWFMQSQDF